MILTNFWFEDEARMGRWKGKGLFYLGLQYKCCIIPDQYNVNKLGKKLYYYDKIEYRKLQKYRKENNKSIKSWRKLNQETQ